LLSEFGTAAKSHAYDRMNVRAVAASSREISRAGCSARPPS
jgi:hypothetical protein